MSDQAIGQTATIGKRHRIGKAAILAAVFAAIIVLYLVVYPSYVYSSYQITLTSVNVSWGDQSFNLINTYGNVTLNSGNSTCGDPDGRNCATIFFSYTNDGNGFSPPDLKSISVQTQGFVVIGEYYSVTDCSELTVCQSAPCVTNTIYNGNAFQVNSESCSSYGFEHLPSGSLPSGDSKEINAAVVVELPLSNYAGPLNLVVNS